MSDLQARINKLSPKQKELLWQQLKRHSKQQPRHSTDDIPIVSYHRQSFGLQREWLLQQKETARQENHAVLLLQIDGRLDKQLLRQNLEIFLDRQPVLHTLLTQENGYLLKKKVKQTLPDLILNDRQLNAQLDDEKSMNLWIDEEAKKPFALTQEPPVRVRLLQIEENCHLLMLVLHCSLSNWRNKQLLLQNICQFLIEDKEIYKLNDKRIHTNHVRQHTTGEESKRRIAYWKTYFEAVPFPCENIHRETRPYPQTYDGTQLKCPLNSKIISQLQSISEQESIPLSIIFLTIFQLWVANHTNHDTVGTQIIKTKLDENMGYFDQPIILRNPQFQGLNFRQIAIRQNKHYNIAQKNEFPLEQLIDELLPKLSLATPLIPVAFNYYPSTQKIWQSAQAKITLIETNNVVTHNDLSLDVIATGKNHETTITVNSTIFSAKTTENMVNSLQTIFEWVAKHPDLPLSDLYSLTPNEIQLSKKDSTPAWPTYQTIIEELVAYIWADTLSIKPQEITSEEKFHALGGHTLDALRILALLRQLLDVDLPITTMPPDVTIKQFVQKIRNQHNSHPWFVLKPYRPGSTLSPIQSEGNKKPLFCIHPVGGDVGCYAILTRYLGEDQPIFGLQAQGIDGRDLPLNNIETMATTYIDAIREAYPTGAFYLAGWSLGGLIALEMAHQLGMSGRETPIVIMFDTQADWIYKPLEERKQKTRSQLILEYFSRALDLSYEAIKSMNKGKQILYIVKQLREADAQVDGISLLEWLDLFSVYEQGNLAVHHYVAKPYFGKVVNFYALDSFLKHPTEFVKWHAVIGKDVEVELVTGDHQNMFSEPHVQMLATKLETYLSTREKVDAHSFIFDRV